MVARRLAENQVALGNNIYFFQSPNAHTQDCVIYGHGAHMANKSFNLPNGKNVIYGTERGHPIPIPRGPIMDYDGNQPVVSPNDRSLYIRGPVNTPDQLLTKMHGNHWADPQQRHGEQYYLAIAQQMRNAHNSPNHWVPHYVSIRNRRQMNMANAVWLSNVIEQVLQYNPNITNFYSMACREYVHPNDVNNVADQSYQ